MLRVNTSLLLYIFSYFSLRQCTYICYVNISTDNPNTYISFLCIKQNRHCFELLSLRSDRYSKITSIDEFSVKSTNKTSKCPIQTKINIFRGLFRLTKLMI